MKKFISDFLFRGLMVAGGGPVVLAIIYGVLGMTGVADSFSPREVCIGIMTITLLALIAGGMTAIYQVERLPLANAIMIHGAALYVAYIVIYLINGWLKQQLIPILTFTIVFILGYAIIWLCIYLYTKTRTQKINRMLRS